MSMSDARIAKLRAFIAARPTDPFPKYALAQEHRNGGNWQAAWEVWDELLRLHPEYTATYLHAGHTLIALERREEAKAVWQRGIDACIRHGDSHARGELESALAEL